MTFDRGKVVSRRAGRGEDVALLLPAYRQQ